ncbi:MAG: sigma-70 family RNA polymerase sigma factor [Myxococcales bacterium]|nr:sigma-70 family RNA polymerase sigma factor [Myxococcales bacterium]
MSTLDEARRLCRALGGDRTDLWSLPAEVVERAAQTDRPLPEVAKDVVSAWYVRQVQQGDRGAVAPLLELWHLDVVRWCRWNAPAREGADDAAHDVMLRAARRLHTLQEVYRVRAWLWAITWRVLREQRRKPWFRRWVFGTTPDTHPSPTPCAHEALEAHERDAAIRHVLERLSLEERTMLWHAYVERRTRPQIATLMNLPTGTVNRLLTQARRVFRAEAERIGLSPHPHEDDERVER